MGNMLYKLLKHLELISLTQHISVIHYYTYIGMYINGTGKYTYIGMYINGTGKVKHFEIAYKMSFICSFLHYATILLMGYSFVILILPV